MPTAPSTKLDAINSVLSAVGEAPITSLDYVLDSASATMASNILDEVDRSFQTRGWSFNTDLGYVFTRDTINNISVASNVIRVNVDEASYQTLKVIQRGTKLYDSKNRTYVFSTNITADIVSLLSFDLLPEPARNYIVTRSSRVFLLRTRPEEAQNKINDADEQLAFANFLEYEVRSGLDTNHSKYSAELDALGINQAVFLASPTDDKLKLIQASQGNLIERQGRLYYENRVQNKTTAISDNYDTYRTQFNRVGLSEKEFLALDPIKKEEALVIAKGTSTTADGRASSFNTANIQTNLRKLGISFVDFLGLDREKQQLLLDGASGLDNIIASTSSAVATFEATGRNKAVNEVFRYLNIPPVSSLTASDTAYTTDKLLSKNEKDIQAEGWHFNTQPNYKLTKDGSGYIATTQVTYPILAVDTDPSYDYAYSLTIRDNKLWNLTKNTNVFTSDIKAELILQIPWDSIPSIIQRFIIVRTAKELAGVLGKKDAMSMLAVEEARVRNEANQFDSETGDYSIFDSYSVARVLDRGTSSSGVY